MSEYKVSVKIAGQLEKSFNSALQGAQKGLEGLGSLGVKSVQLAAKSLTAAGAAIGAVGVASVNVGREFEAQMSSTAATAGATEEEYKKLEAAAMECGRTTSKTATESSAALEYMALAGWSVNDSISALPSVLRLSEATGLDLARTSDLVTDSMSACGVSVDNLAGYLDICAKANNKSNQTAEQLMEAYLGVGGVMTNLNVPLTESATALGVLANRGIKGSEAGNALNAIMANLTTGTGQAGEMMKSLGISAFDSEGKFIGLKATLETLNTALSGCTEEERNAALAAIGGKQHVDALNDLMSGLNTTLEDGSTEWENLTKELENCDGALEAMAQTKLDNLNGDLAIFQSALEDTGIKIYKNLQGPLREVVQFGTDQIYRLSDALADGGFQGMAETLGDVLADCVTEVANYAPQLVTMASTLMSSLLRGLVDNAPTLTSAAATLATSIITAIVQYIAEFYTTGATLLAQFLQGMVGKMPEIIQAGITATQNLSQGILSQFPTIVSAALQIGTQLINGLAVMLPTLLNMGIQMGSACSRNSAAGSANHYRRSQSHIPVSKHTALIAAAACISRIDARAGHCDGNCIWSSVHLYGWSPDHPESGERNPLVPAAVALAGNAGGDDIPSGPRFGTADDRAGRNPTGARSDSGNCTEFTINFDGSRFDGSDIAVRIDSDAAADHRIRGSASGRIAVRYCTGTAEHHHGRTFHDSNSGTGNRSVDSFNFAGCDSGNHRIRAGDRIKCRNNRIIWNPVDRRARVWTHSGNPDNRSGLCTDSGSNHRSNIHNRLDSGRSRSHKRNRRRHHKCLRWPRGLRERFVE